MEGKKDSRAGYQEGLVAAEAPDCLTFNSVGAAAAKPAAPASSRKFVSPTISKIDNPRGLPIETLDVIDGEKGKTREKVAISKYLYKKPN